MLNIHHFVFNDFQENTYVIWDQTLACAIIDPGCFRAQEQTTLTQFIKNKQLTPALLLNTHCHIDHILGNKFVSDHYQLALHMHQGELETYHETGRWAAMFNLPAFEIPENRIYLKEGDQVKFGQSELKVLFTPGHSLASISFYNEASNSIIAGDVLFKGSIGRTDLPGGDFDILANSIRTQLYTLPDETKVYSGHGPSTTIGHERAFNLYVRG